VQNKWCVTENQAFERHIGVFLYLFGMVQAKKTEMYKTSFFQTFNSIIVNIY